MGSKSQEITWPGSMDRKTLLIYENMLESIATVRSECTTKPENKMGYNTDHIVPNLIDFFGDD